MVGNIMLTLEMVKFDSSLAQIHDELNDKGADHKKIMDLVTKNLIMNNLMMYNNMTTPKNTMK